MNHVPEFLAQLKEFKHLTLIPSGVYFQHQSWIGLGKLRETVDAFRCLTSTLSVTDNNNNGGRNGWSASTSSRVYDGLDLALSVEMDSKIFAPFFRTWCQRWCDKLEQEESTNDGFGLDDLTSWTQFVFSWMGENLGCESSSFSLGEIAPTIQQAIVSTRQRILSLADYLYSMDKSYPMVSPKN